jgi:nitrate reductase NapE component
MANPREKVTVFAFAAFVLVAIVGGAFVAGYLIGRMIL